MIFLEDEWLKELAKKGEGNDRYDIDHDKGDSKEG